MPKKIVAINFDAKIRVNLLSRTHFHSIVTTKFVPPNPGKDLLEPPKGATTTIMQLIIPYSKPFKRPLYYPEYNKDFDVDAHIQVFKAIIKANGERINEEITNLLKFTLRNNTSNECNNYMWDNPNYRFANLE